MSDCNVYYFLDPECGKYKERGLKHSLDIWHAAKILGKKIQDPKIPRSPWIKDIMNHFWYCAKQASFEEQFKVGLCELQSGKHNQCFGV